MFLLDTSIPELELKLGLGEAGAGAQQPQEQSSTALVYWVIFFIVISAVSGVAAYMLVKKRRASKPSPGR